MRVILYGPLPPSYLEGVGPELVEAQVVGAPVMIDGSGDRPAMRVGTVVELSEVRGDGVLIHVDLDEHHELVTVVPDSTDSAAFTIGSPADDVSGTLPA